jgi:Tol biopolymer transport system component
MSVKLSSFVFTLILFCRAVAVGGVPPDLKGSIDRAIDRLFAPREFKEVTISADGKRVAWVEWLQGKNYVPSPNSLIFVSNLSSTSTPPQCITAGNGSTPYAEHDVAWSPDGSWLAFLSDRGKPGQLDLYVANVASGPPRKLTSLTGFLALPQRSPDGKTLALLFTENAPRAGGPPPDLVVLTR